MFVCLLDELARAAPERHSTSLTFPSLTFSFLDLSFLDLNFLDLNDAQSRRPDDSFAACGRTLLPFRTRQRQAHNLSHGPFVGGPLASLTAPVRHRHVVFYMYTVNSLQITILAILSYASWNRIFTVAQDFWFCVETSVSVFVILELRAADGCQAQVSALAAQAWARGWGR